MALRKNPIYAALSKGQIVTGAFQMLTDPAVTEVILKVGYDFILLDTEHRAINPETVEHLIRAAHGAGANKAAIVRVSTLRRDAVQYALDAGAEGVLVPLLGTPQQAEEAASYARFPPAGSRGLNSMVRGAGWRAEDPPAYTAAASQQVLLAVQIETEEGVENASAIAAVPGVDVVFVGPYDLSHGMGRTGQLGHPKVRAAIRKVFAAGRAAGKHLGILAPDLKFARWAIDEGVHFMVYRSDMRFLTAQAQESAKEIAVLAGDQQKP